MCLLVFAWKIHPHYPLVFAGNRDELHARPSLAAGFWDDAPEVLGGRDLEAGGTWLGVTTSGRFAVVTNYREGPVPQKGPRSRGVLTADFLRGDAQPDEYIERVRKHAQDFAPFSLIIGNRDQLYYFSNRSDANGNIAPGIHGLSNHLLDTPWPKVSHSMAWLETLPAHGAPTTEPLFKLLADRTPAPADTLPDTGVGVEREQLLSPVFVVNPVYGTRCSSVIVMQRNGSIHFAERRFDAAGQALETRCFHIAGSPA
ncbi:MAG: NRDE family protein [Gammaproteobacteria bacterium]